MINIGSEIAELGNSNFGNYASAKGAMLSMTRSWANELGPEGITVNLVAPGWIPVERHADAPQATLDWYRDRVPLGHFGVPHDIAAIVVFLASEKANFITGQKFRGQWGTNTSLKARPAARPLTQSSRASKAIYSDRGR